MRQVGDEMNTQIANHIGGKVIEVVLVGGISCLTFALMDLRYAILLGVLVGLSVLIPYIGAKVRQDMPPTITISMTLPRI